MRSAERIRSTPATTLGLLVREGARRFRSARLSFGHGTGNAFDEAAWLALHALRLSAEDFEIRRDVPLTATQARRVRALFERRVRERKPAAYITREAWLANYRFYVDERVIVPRSYIAELLQDRLAPWVSRPQRIKSALDLCTGSGCLAVMLADVFPHAVVDAVDLMPDALKVARRNVSAYRLANRVRLLRSDLFEELGARRYDLIISNPPYVRAAVMRRLPQEYRSEPALALAGGRDGLDLVRRILRQAAAHLTRHGLLVVEVGHNRDRVERAFPRLEFTWPLTAGGDDCVFVLERAQLCRPHALTGTGPAAP